MVWRPHFRLVYTLYIMDVVLIMKQNMNAVQFHDAMQCSGFSPEALDLIFQFLEATQPKYVFDYETLRCCISEETTEQVCLDYPVGTTPVLEFLQEYTTVIGQTPTGFVYYFF